MSDESFHPSPKPDGGGDERISTLVGDRLCIGCGYNLTGQAVVRERHYRMLIVRCPECGTVASLQEYPALGRWAGRWAALLAAGWAGALVIAALASAGILTGVAWQVGASAAEPWAGVLSDRYREHLQELRYQGNLPQQQQWVLQQGGDFIDTTWLAGQNLDGLLREAGGVWGAADLTALRHWIWISLAAAAIGCIWSVALLHLRRRGLLVAGLILIAITAGFVTMARLNSASPSWLRGMVLAREYAIRHVGWPWILVSVGFAAMPLAAGLLVGRSLARLLVRVLLPPRLRGPLAFLWKVDGLDPPPGDRRYRAGQVPSAGP